MLIEQIAPTLNFMHERGVLHLDVKPENIYVTRNGCFKIGDFGMSVAKEFWGKGEQEGDSMYLAPEVLREGLLGPSADLFSFGMTLHRLVTGECVHITSLTDKSNILRKTDFPISRELRQLITALIDPKMETRANSKAISAVITSLRQKQRKMMLLTRLHG